MQLPIVSPAPIVEQHAPAFRDLFGNHCQFDHFQNYLTGLMVLNNKSLSNITQCILESSDKSNLSRFFSQSPWRETEVNERRLKYMLEQTASHRRRKKDSILSIDDTLCEHVGSLFEYVDRHYDHSENRYPLAHNLVSSYFVSGPVRFPMHAHLYRRYEEKTQWEYFLKKHFPQLEIPRKAKERKALHKKLDAILLTDPDFAKLDAEFRTKISLAVELIEEALKSQIPFQTVLMDSWFLAPELIESIEQYGFNWVSLLKKNRKLETSSFTLRDEQGQSIPIAGPHIKVEELVKLIPKNAFKQLTLGENDYWYFALNVRIPDFGKVRLVISFNNAELTGTYAVLVSNRTDWSAKKMILTYLQRWPIETFYQDSKGHLGLDEYRMRTAEAFQKHWCLVFVAYSFLHLNCLPASLKHARSINFPIRTIGEVCRQQGQFLIQKLILTAHDLLQQGTSEKDVFGNLFAKQKFVVQN